MRAYICNGCGTPKPRHQVSRVRTEFRTMDGKRVLKVRKEGHRCFTCLAADGVPAEKLSEAESRLA